MKQINFVNKKNIAFVFSTILLIISISSLFTQGLKLGIDFTGGFILEVGYKKTANLEIIRGQLTNAGFDDITVQYFGNNTDVLIRLAPQKTSSAKLSSKALVALAVDGDSVKMRRVEFVGPKVGEELTNDGALAVLYALIGILIYVAFRFEYRFSIGAVLALMHDVIITLGVFSLLQIEFDLTVLAAILAVIGYSLNDTIVVFDRIRENFISSREEKPAIVINNSINQTLARTLATSGTTILVLVALFLFGGEIIRGFSIALLTGVIIGTYSSIYTASSLLLVMGATKAHLMPSEKEQKAIDTRP